MGYSHYFKNDKIPQKTWDAFTKDVKVLYGNLPEHSTSAGGHYDDKPLKIDDQEGGEPIADKDRVWFNGAGYPDADHETFGIYRIGSHDACKTARKPYDLVVCACLLLLHKHAPTLVSVSSDGDLEDWLPAVELLKKLELFDADLDAPLKIALQKEKTIITEIYEYLLQRKE